MFLNGAGKSWDLDSLLREQILPLLDRCFDCGRTRTDHDAKTDHIFRLDNVNRAWRGWHSFRRGLATNLHRLSVDDKTIQSILRHSNIATTQNIYIKSLPADAIAAMKRLESLMERQAIN
jgi:integrase